MDSTRRIAIEYRREVREKKAYWEHLSTNGRLRDRTFAQRMAKKYAKLERKLSLRLARD